VKMAANSTSASPNLDREARSIIRNDCPCIVLLILNPGSASYDAG
jgi:hypothetical protein